MKNKRPKILALLKKARHELHVYRKTRKFTNLSQACEKTWVAFNLTIEYVKNKEIRTSKGIKDAALELNLLGLYREARYLHVIHYEGSPGVDDDELISDVIRTGSEIEALVI